MWKFQVIVLTEAKPWPPDQLSIFKMKAFKKNNLNFYHARILVWCAFYLFKHWPLNWLCSLKWGAKIYLHPSVFLGKEDTCIIVYFVYLLQFSFLYRKCRAVYWGLYFKFRASCNIMKQLRFYSYSVDMLFFNINEAVLNDIVTTLFVVSLC